MPDNLPLRIVESLVSGEVARDATQARVVLLLKSKKRLYLGFTLPALAQTVGRLTDMLAWLQTQTGTKAGHLEIRAVPVRAASAQTPVGSTNTLLMIRADNGTLQHFALTQAQTSELREALAKAETEADQNSKRSIQ